MSRRTKILASPTIQRTLNVRSWVGAVETLSVDYRAEAVEMGTAISEVSWSVSEDAVVSLSGATISGYTSSVTMAANVIGSAIVRNRVVFTNDAIRVNIFRVKVRDYTSVSPA